MSVTSVRIGDPFTLGPFAAAFVKVTFDASYDQNNEYLLAGSIGFMSFVSVLSMGMSTKTSATGHGVRATVISSGTAARVQLFETGAAVDTAFDEVDAAQNEASTTALFLVIGYA